MMIAWYLKNVYYAIVEVSLLGSLGAARGKNRRKRCDVDHDSRLASGITLMRMHATYLTSHLEPSLKVHISAFAPRPSEGATSL